MHASASLAHRLVASIVLCNPNWRIFSMQDLREMRDLLATSLGLVTPADVGATAHATAHDHLRALEAEILTHPSSPPGLLK